MRQLMLIIITIAILTSCTKTDGKSDRLQIATSIYPIADIVQNIAGDKATVRYIVPPGANPHNFTPTPAQVKKVYRSDFFIGVSPLFDGWTTKFINKEADIYYLTSSDQHDADQHNGKHHHDKTKYIHKDHNPHIWLSVQNTIEIANRIQLFLTEADPTNSLVYISNTIIYIAKLHSLNTEISQLFTHITNRSFIQWHPAWNYFACDYNLQIIGTIEQGHGKSISILDYAKLVQKAKQQNIKTIVLGMNIQSTTATSLAREINGKIIRLDAIGNPNIEGRDNYIKMMRYNAKQLAEELE